MVQKKIIDFKEHTDGRGSLIALEYPKQIPIEIKRIYYIYNVKKDTPRGFHSHKNLNQILIAISGCVKVKISDSYEDEIITLDSNNKGLLIGPMIWREMFDFSKDAVLLVLADHEYDESDYIRDYDEFIKLGREYWKK
ncbi:MAG: FdtA/QdtA family cupin domain-containing protein [Bacilli bacterium]|nr:FdtA/QdtA family cupin domain-containing protein [Bacilli bacterium]